MVKAISCVIVGLIVTVTFAQYILPRPTSKVAKQTISTSEKVNGIALFLVVPAVSKAGQPVTVTVGVTNDGPERPLAFIPKRGVLPPFEFDVVDARGMRAHLTAYGKKHLRPSDGSEDIKQYFGSFGVYTIEEKTKFDLGSLTVSLFLDLTLPGEYFLIARYSVLIGESDSGKAQQMSARARIVIGAP